MSRGVWWLRPTNFPTRVVALGYTGVSFFFILSGFVLSMAYLKTGHSFEVGRFLSARFARIYPALLVSLLFDLPHFLHVEMNLLHERWGEVLAGLGVSFGALEGWFPRVQALNTPSWSITDEFFFYLLFPWVAVVLWRMRPWALCALSVSVYVVNNGIVLALGRRYPGTDGFSLNPLTHLAEFVIGIAVARLAVGISKSTRWSALWRRCAPVVALGAAGLFLAIPGFSVPIPISLLQHTLLAPIFAAMILALSSGNRTLSAIFSARWFVVLGESSFALYLFHVPLLVLLRIPIEHHQLLFPPIFLLTAIGLSVASFYWLETPSRRWILSRLHVRSREDVVTQAIAQ
jgi:peptidoglycan/LPS O-acetylase OafA/YrhL